MFDLDERLKESSFVLTSLKQFIPTIAMKMEHLVKPKQEFRSMSYTHSSSMTYSSDDFLGQFINQNAQDKYDT